jgi:hypothetical protein
MMKIWGYIRMTWTKKANLLKYASIDKTHYILIVLLTIYD